MCIRDFPPVTQNFFGTPVAPALHSNEVSWFMMAARVACVATAVISGCITIATGSVVAGSIALVSVIITFCLFDCGSGGGLYNYVPSNAWLMSSSPPLTRVHHHHHSPPSPGVFLAPQPRQPRNRGAALPTSFGIDLAERAPLGHRDQPSSSFSTGSLFSFPSPVSSTPFHVPNIAPPVDITARAPLGRRDEPTRHDPFERAALGSRS